jgi:hypothetical protein
MSDMDHEDRLLASAYENLSKEAAPSPELENRILSVLRNQGLVGRKRSSHSFFKLAATIAACILFFLAGVYFQKESRPTVQSTVSMTEKTFAFFLIEDEHFQKPQNEAELQERIDLYRSWGRRLKDKGVLVNGTKLKDERYLLSANGAEREADTSEIAGYFLIDATNLSNALEIARTCPHLRFGGKIEIRQIHPV